jgi:mutator protein MutT
MSKIQSEDLLIDCPGGHVYVKKWIPKDLQHNVPVVLLHDSLGSTDLWLDFPEKLSTLLSRVVFSYDRLGFGKSSARDVLPGKGFIGEEAEIYFPDIKKALSLDRYILFGHSVGGAMCIEIAARDTDCLAVITEASQAFVEDLTISGIQKAQRAFQEPSRFERIKKWHGDKAAWVLRSWTDIWLSREFASWSLDPCIGNVRCPVLAIHGDNDAYGSKAFPEFISGKTGGESEMLIVKNCGHVPHRERVQEVMGGVEAFLQNMTDQFPKRIKSKPVPTYKIAVGVVRHKGKMLITHRKPEGLLGGLWEFPGGKLKKGESSQTACIREIYEETGLRVEVDSYITQVKHTYTHFKIVMDIFYCRYISGDVQLNGPVDFQWIELSEIDHFAFPKANLKFIPFLEG